MDWGHNDPVLILGHWRCYKSRVWIFLMDAYPSPCALLHALPCSCYRHQACLIINDFLDACIALTMRSFACSSLQLLHTSSMPHPLATSDIFQLGCLPHLARVTLTVMLCSRVGRQTAGKQCVLSTRWWSMQPQPVAGATRVLGEQKGRHNACSLCLWFC